MTKAEREREEARQHLLELVKPGDTILCVLESVARSGMSRRIKFYVQGGPGQEPVYLAGWMSKLLGVPRGRHDGIRIDGCGSDAGFDAVYAMASYLWPEGFQCTGGRCPCNEHHNPPHPERDGKMWHARGDYALQHRWL